MYNGKPAPPGSLLVQTATSKTAIWDAVGNDGEFDLSHGGRFAVGLVAFTCAASFFLLAATSGALLPAGPLPYYGLATFCFIISLACLVRRSRPFTLRIIGAIIFLSYLFYVYDSRGDKSLLTAIAGFCVWGLPSGYLMVKGTYPTWGKASTAFNTEDSPRHDNSQ
jgi:hypothetical protein